ncbi:carbon starvation CstA family protein [Acinetobacter baumannii]
MLFLSGRLALSRGEHVNAVWLVLAAACVYSIAYRFYSLFIATKVFELNPRRLTPAHRLADGLDYVPTNKYVLFGTPLCRDCRRRAISRADFGCTNGLFTGHYLVIGWCGLAGAVARLSSFIYINTP